MSAYKTFGDDTFIKLTGRIVSAKMKFEDLSILMRTPAGQLNFQFCCRKIEINKFHVVAGSSAMPININVHSACFSKPSLFSIGLEADAVSHYLNAIQAAQIFVG